MWFVSQGAPFIVVHFQPNNYEYKQLWQSEQTPVAILTYSSIDSLVKLSQEALKLKLWILVIVSRGDFCHNDPASGIGSASMATILN